MNISITARGFDLSDAARTYVQNSIDSLNLYKLDIISVNVIASLLAKKNRDSFGVEYVLHLAHKNSIVVDQKDDDLYAAIDLASARAKKALGRIHDRDSYHFKDGLNGIKNETISLADINNIGEAMEDEIVPVELELYKPREVEDVLSDLKESGKLFDIFLDNDGKTRVLYKRNDGRFGLY